MMKHFLCLCLMLFALSSAAQTESDQPYKGANTIIIHTTDSASAVYGKLGRTLLDGGFAVDKSDKDLGYINTAAHKIGKSPYETVMRFSINPAAGGSIITVQGSIRNTLVVGYRAPGFTPIENRNAFGSPSIAGWMEMTRVSKLYPSGRLSYLTKP